MYYHMKDKGSNRHWKRNMRKARKKALNNEKVDMGELFDFSEQTVGWNREIVAASIHNQPRLAEDVKNFGMPPIFTPMQKDLVIGGMFMGSNGTNFILIGRDDTLQDVGVHDLLNPDLMRSKGKKVIAGTEWFLETNGKTTPQAVLSHEYGHYINYLSLDVHPDRESRYLASWYWRMSWDENYGHKERRAWRKWREKNPGIRLDTADKRWEQTRQIMDAIDDNLFLGDDGPPHVLSQYGQTNPAEMFAEGYAALASGDVERMNRVKIGRAHV